jgi:COMPASS component SWD3
MDGSVILVDMTTQTIIQTRSREHGKYATRIRFSSCGKYCVSASYDKSVIVYRVVMNERGGNSDSTPQSPFKARLVRCAQLSFRGAVESLAFRPNTALPTFVVGTRDDNELHFVTLMEGNSSSMEDADQGSSSIAYTIRRHNMNTNGDNWVSFTPMDMVFHASGDYLVVYTDSQAGRIIVYRSPSTEETTTQNESRLVSNASPELESESESALSSVNAVGPPMTIYKSIYGIMCDEFSQPRLVIDDTLVYATSDDHAIHVFDIASGKKLERLAGHTGVVRGLDFSGGDSGMGLVSCGFDKSVRIWG